MRVLLVLRRQGEFFEIGCVPSGRWSRRVFVGADVHACLGGKGRCFAVLAGWEEACGQSPAFHVVFCCFATMVVWSGIFRASAKVVCCQPLRFSNAFEQLLDKTMGVASKIFAVL